MESHEVIPTVMFSESQPVRPLRRSEYDRLVDLGVFGNEKIELLQGILAPMSPQGSRHAYAIQVLTRILAPALKGRAEVRVQMPFAASPISEPEPDVAVVEAGDGAHHHPSRASLLVEVADSSLADARKKAPVYAAAGVSEYWIVDATSETITVHRAPVDGEWTQVARHGREETIAPHAFPDVRITVAELFPR